MDDQKSDEKFVRLAESRVNRVLKDLRLVGNLSNRNNYHYSQEDARKIVEAIEKAVREVKKRFESSESSLNEDFRL